MKKISATEFRTHCYQWIEHVRSTREHIVITKRGKAVAKLVPLERDDLIILEGSDARANKRGRGRPRHTG